MANDVQEGVGADASVRRVFLYHGTGIYCLAAILQGDQLLEGIHWGKPNEPHGPRLSESFEIAASFIEYQLPWGGDALGGVLVLDGNALARDFETTLYVDKTYAGETWGNDEKELVVCTPRIENLSRYLVSVVCSDEAIDIALERETMNAANEECGWAFDDDLEVGIPRAIEALEALRHSPYRTTLAPDGSRVPSIQNVGGRSPALKTKNI